MMACGLATIASEHLNKKPFCRWLVKDGLNTVVPENSPDSIAESLKRLIEDEPYRISLSRTGQHTMSLVDSLMSSIDGVSAVIQDFSFSGMVGRASSSYQQ
jgi:hypothetical protein